MGKQGLGEQKEMDHLGGKKDVGSSLSAFERWKGGAEVVGHVWRGAGVWRMGCWGVPVLDLSSVGSTLTESAACSAALVSAELSRLP